MIELPWPPSINNYYSVVHGRKVLSKRGRQYKKDAVHLMMEQVIGKNLQGKVAINIHAHPPDNRKRDLDNILKPVLDSLTEYGVFPDDSVVDDLRIMRFPKVKGGVIRITVASY